MISERMCVACRKIQSKENLIRIVRVKGLNPEIDLELKAQGRGAYICKDRDCLVSAIKRKSFERALGGNIDKSLFDRIEEIING